jgi:hypothetical protein
VTIEGVPNWRGGIHIGATAGGENGSDDFGAFEADNGFPVKEIVPVFLGGKSARNFLLLYLGTYAGFLK